MVMAGAHLEVSLEELIAEHLVANGWVRGLPEHFDRDLGLDTAELFAFIGATQGEAWEQLVLRHGNNVEVAQRKFAQRVASEVDAPGDGGCAAAGGEGPRGRHQARLLRARPMT